MKNNFKSAWATNLIIVLLCGIFLLEVAYGGSENARTLLNLGATFNPLIASGQWYRLFTAQFLHIGLTHLFSNLVMIYYLGANLEQVLGHWRFLALYLASGVGGNLLSFAIGGDTTIGAGASTALFGLIGAQIILGFSNRNYPIMAYFGRQAFFLAVFNLVIDMFIPEIDLVGHLGGLITGVMLTFVLGSPRLRKYDLKLRLLFAVLIIIYCVWCISIGKVVSY